MRELREHLTPSEKAHWLAFWNIYGPVGEEAMDIYVAAVLAKLESGVPTIQVKKGKNVKWTKHMPFNREFWTRSLGPKALVKKALSIFSGMGMKVKKGKDG